MAGGVHNLVAALAMAILSAATGMAAANSALPAAPASGSCDVAFNDLMPCIDFVNANSSGPPSPACCTAFVATQNHQPECLCQLQQAFQDPATAPGNATRAGQIPTLCKVAVDYTKCAALLGSVYSPTPSPTPGFSPSHPPHHIAPAPASASANASANSPAPAPAPRKGSDFNCDNSFTELTSCLGYVSGDGKGGPPKDCCTAIGSVQGREPVCLCQLLASVNDSASYGVNATLAESLPRLCHVAADTTRCAALLNSPLGSLGGPASSPVIHAPSPSPLAIVPTPAHAPVLVPVSMPASAPSPTVDCSSQFSMLQPCLAYVMASDQNPPSAECCTSLGSVVADKPVCLCQLLQTVGSGDPATAGMNVTRALGLASVCKVVTDVGMCPALLGQPVSSPAPAAPSTGGSPSPIGEGDNPSEAPAPSPSGSSSVRPTMVAGTFFIVAVVVVQDFIAYRGRRSST